MDDKLYGRPRRTLPGARHVLVHSSPAQTTLQNTPWSKAFALVLTCSAMDVAVVAKLPNSYAGALPPQPHADTPRCTIQIKNILTRLICRPAARTQCSLFCKSGANLPNSPSARIPGVCFHPSLDEFTHHICRPNVVS